MDLDSILMAAPLCVRRFGRCVSKFRCRHARSEPTRTERQAGQVLVIFILVFIPVIVAAGAISIDLGRAYLARTSYQQVATDAAEAGAGQTDLCALAEGMVVLNDGTMTTACTADPSQLSAQAMAKEYLYANLSAANLSDPSNVQVLVIQDGSGGGGCDFVITNTCYRYPTVVVAFTAILHNSSFAEAAFGRASQTIHVAVAATASQAATNRSL
jgi:hypothetical protein